MPSKYGFETEDERRRVQERAVKERALAEKQRLADIAAGHARLARMAARYDARVKDVLIDYIKARGTYEYAPVEFSPSVSAWTSSSIWVNFFPAANGNPDTLVISTANLESAKEEAKKVAAAIHRVTGAKVEVRQTNARWSGGMGGDWISLPYTIVETFG